MHVDRVDLAGVVKTPASHPGGDGMGRGRAVCWAGGGGRPADMVGGTVSVSTCVKCIYGAGIASGPASSRQLDASCGQQAAVGTALPIWRERQRRADLAERWRGTDCSGGPGGTASPLHGQNRRTNAARRIHRAVGGSSRRPDSSAAKSYSQPGISHKGLTHDHRRYGTAIVQWHVGQYAGAGVGWRALDWTRDVLAPRACRLRCYPFSRRRSGGLRLGVGFRLHHPMDLRSGCYVLHVTCADGEDWLPFYVLRPGMAHAHQSFSWPRPSPIKPTPIIPAAMPMTLIARGRRMGRIST